jgi:predicted RNase H-like HicB family nuclease
MKTIRIIIERNEDGFWGYSETEKGITGGGDTIQECKQDLLDCIETLKMLDTDNRPVFLDEAFEFIYKFDAESFFSYYKGVFTNSAFEKLTGINRKQIQHYASGHRKPKEETTKKIETALHNLGRELLALEL